MVHIIENPPVPMVTPIYEGFRKHAIVEIFGEVYQGNQGGFTIEFPSSKGIPLHISVRMGTNGQNTIAFNHLDHGRWHQEIHHPNRIFFGRPFHLKIINEHRKYEVHVDGVHLGHYHNHMCPKKINSMTIRGDLRISKIHFENFKHQNGGGTIAPIPVVPAQPIIVQPPTVVRPIYPSVQPVQQVVYPTATPVIYTQPEVIYLDGYHHHHRHHC